MTTIEKICPICNSSFTASLSEHNRGNARVCSKKCAHKSSSIRNSKQTKPNTICSLCNKQFYKSKSRKKSKSGLYFCCKEHKNLAQRITSGFTEMYPSHYGSGTTRYRIYALDTYGPKCQLCGYNKHIGVLQVHHKDKNRNNNDINNLLVCCPTCHAEQHLIDGVVNFSC